MNFSRLGLIDTLREYFPARPMKVNFKLTGWLQTPYAMLTVM
ncbi:MAG: hypothetical protein N2508_02575 [Anaerolineae bacterium]|nr:hypothetical protein [Anaerolineae bacterium]